MSQTVREIIDPQRTLPEIELVLSGRKEWQHEDATDYSIVCGDRKVGLANINESSETGHYFNCIDVYMQHLQPGSRRGFGLATYVTAIERAHAQERVFRTGRSITPESLRIWNKFIDLGIATVVEPLTLRGVPDPFQGEGVYYGIVQVHKP